MWFFSLNYVVEFLLKTFCLSPFSKAHNNEINIANVFNVLNAMHLNMLMNISHFFTSKFKAPDFSDQSNPRPLEAWLCENCNIRNFLMRITWCMFSWWCVLENRLVANNAGNSCLILRIDWSHGTRQRICVHAVTYQTYAISMYINVSPGELNDIAAACYFNVLFNLKCSSAKHTMAHQSKWALSYGKQQCKARKHNWFT